jgi:hypothetical protein
MKRYLVRLALFTAAAITLTLPVGQATYADKDWSNNCHQKLESDRARIDRDAAKHGEHSGQVGRDVSRLDQDRQWCRDHHADWDHTRFDVGIYVKP